MPYKPITIDASVGRIEEGSPRLPEGFYLVEFEGLDPTAEELPEDKHQGYWHRMRVISGPDSNPSLGLGGRFREFILMDKPDQYWKLGRTLAVYGFDSLSKQMEKQPVSLPTYQHFSAFAARLAQNLNGRRAVAFVTDQPNSTNGRVYSGVEALHKESDWVNYRQHAPLGATTAPRSNGPATGNPNPLEGASDLFADLEP